MSSGILTTSSERPFTRAERPCLSSAYWGPPDAMQSLPTHNDIRSMLQAFDSLVTSRDDEGDGFSLINNTIGYNRGRG